MRTKDLYEMLDSTEEYLHSLNKPNSFGYYPSVYGLTNYGKKLELGFSTFGLKILKMINRLEEYDLESWAGYINSFQSSNYKNIPANSFVDPFLVESYNDNSIDEVIKDNIKKGFNLFGKKYDTKNIKFRKSVNAETKQAIATLNEIGYSNKLNLEINKSNHEIITELKNLNWETPWSAGGQFSTYCVYSNTQKLNLESILKNFTSGLVNRETGSYYTKTPKNSREIIIAMKVISGLEWIDQEIHFQNS